MMFSTLRKNKLFLVLFSIFFTGCNAETSSSTPSLPIIPDTPKSHFFIVAHPDDIELFMANQTRNLLSKNLKDRKIFIVLTAGDAKTGNSLPAGKNIRFWKSREIAHISSIASWMPETPTPNEQNIQFEGKKINRIVLDEHTTLYNIRLPDNPTKSLSLLLNGQIQTLSPINDSEQKYSLDDLHEILLHIVNAEKFDNNPIVFNLTDPSNTFNPKDHTDHVAASKIALGFISRNNYQSSEVSLYTTYSNTNKEINMTKLEYNDHLQTLANISNIMLKNGWSSFMDQKHLSFIGKEYTRKNNSLDISN